jgi:ATP:ADP antiporter, AAA family
MNTPASLDESNRPLRTEDDIEEEIRNKIGFFKFIRLAKCEYRLWWTMASMFGIAVFVYSVTRIMKDSIVFAKQVRNSIFFIKTIFILPFSVFFVGLVQKGLTIYSVSKVFDIILVIFTVLFLLIGGIIMPLSFYIQPGPFWARDFFADGKMLVKGLDNYLTIMLVINDWTSTLVYVTAEMFGALVVQYIFLAFANDVLTSRQCSRFIPLFYIFSNILLLISAFITNCLSAIIDRASYFVGNLSIWIFLGTCGFFTGLIFLIKTHLERSILSTPLFIRTDFKKRAHKQSISFMEGIKIMLQSRFLIAISSNCLFYAIATNVIESAWKSSLDVAADAYSKKKEAYVPKFMSYEQMIIGLVVVGVLLSPVSTMIQRKGWISLAIVPPFIAMVSSVVVFGAAYYNMPLSLKQKKIRPIDIKGSEDKKTLVIENYAGLVAVAFMKIAKYAFFDIAKEAISMQIDSAYRAKFKAIYDGLCGKVGKSIGSLYGAGWDLSGYSDMRGVSSISFCVVTLFSLIWIRAIIYLNNKYDQSIQTSSPIDIDLFSGKKSFD